MKKRTQLVLEVVMRSGAGVAEWDFVEVVETAAVTVPDRMSFPIQLESDEFATAV
jgi:hypothetical protein